ncbi:mannose-6-phosphate isomerase, class I [Arcanobacterium ihumii]|uniref:mannose-6-phosphate isomerase, class I n=1 Tax=Arcanobacterium ihumii TaxID=2138162 RepID=UPI000F53D127|nr:mannose-6-phosphate isomerase, class I [Arcanobacterium ihumii]
MERLQGRIRDYSWGSTHAIPGFFGLEPASKPIAELWLGAHVAAPAVITQDIGSPAVVQSELYADSGKGSGECTTPVTNPDLFLNSYIASNPDDYLGEDVVQQLGPRLPFLLKLIAPDQPLSLQVHPSRVQAIAGFDRENQAGIERFAPHRSYRDRRHKPELVYALTRFEALVGFRAPRRIMGVLSGLGTPITRKMFSLISENPNSYGVRQAFSYLLSEETRPSPEDVAAVVAACARRRPEDSPSPRADSIVARLARSYPEDPGVVASLLLNPVTLNRGEALFIPVGTVHAYLMGFGVEVMANSDNVLRAGLTSKHIDINELLNVMDTVAAPPIRIAPERVNDMQSTFYAPVDDFELSIIEASSQYGACQLHGTGPRIMLCLEGHASLWTPSSSCDLSAGQAVFIGADDGRVSVKGDGRLIMADVP